MVILLVAALGVVSYSIIQRNRITSKGDVKLAADNDIEEATVRVGTFFITPANCNANFFGKPSSGSLTEIRSCTSGNCASVASGVAEIGVFAPSSTVWKDSSVATGGTGISDRVRINSITYSVTSPQGVVPSRAAILTINVTFEQNLGLIPDPNNQNNATQRRLTKQVLKSFQAFVKTHNWSGPPDLLTVHPSGLIYGCTKSPNTSTVY